MKSQIKRVYITYRTDHTDTITAERTNGKTAVYPFGEEPEAVRRFMRGRLTKTTQALPEESAGEYLVSVYYREF